MPPTCKRPGQYERRRALRPSTESRSQTRPVPQSSVEPTQRVAAAANSRRFTEPQNDGEEDRRQEDAEQRHAHHAAEHGDPQRPAHLRPGPRGHDQRDHSDDERERGHQDRPQPQPARLPRRLVARPALQVLLLGVLDDQDGVLARQPHQHHQADLHEDVDIPTRVEHARHRTEQAHRHHQDDRQRQRPALVERRQGQEDADDRQREDVRSRGFFRRPDLHEHQLGPLTLHGERQGLIGRFVDGRRWRLRS